MLSSVITGIISGILASLILSFIMFGMKPKIAVSDVICHCGYDEEHRLYEYEIKLVNFSRFNIVDISYSLQHCTRRDKLAQYVEIEPAKAPLGFMNAYSPADTMVDYAMRITYFTVEPLELEGDEVMVFIFQARHSFSGATRFITKEYTASNIKKAQFAPGESTDYVLLEAIPRKTFQKTHTV